MEEPKKELTWEKSKNFSELTIRQEKDGWKIVRISPSGGESLKAENFTEMVYKAMEALVRMGQEPVLKE